MQRRPGFWIAEGVGPGSGGNAADPPPAVLHAADTPPPAGAAACVSYPLPVIVGGQSLQATVVACPQPDGSWQATQYTPGLPPQVYTVPPPPAAGASPNDYASPGYYQDWGPDWAGGPWFWGFAPGDRRGAKIPFLPRVQPWLCARFQPQICERPRPWLRRRAWRLRRHAPLILRGGAASIMPGREPGLSGFGDPGITFWKAGGPPGKGVDGRVRPGHSDLKLF